MKAWDSLGVRVPSLPNLVLLAGASLAMFTSLGILVDVRIGLVFALGLGYAVLLLVRPDLLLYGIVALLVIGIDGWAPDRSPDDVIFRLGVGRIYLLELLVYPLLAGLLFKKLALARDRKRSWVLRTPLDGPMLLFALLLPLFAFYGVFQGNAFDHAFGYYEWRSLFLAVALYFLLANMLETAKAANRLFWWFFVLVSLKAAYFLMLYMLDMEGLLPLVLGTGPQNEGPENVMFMLAALAGAALLVIARSLTSARRVFVLLSTLAMVVNVGLSLKRNPQLGLACGLFVLALVVPMRQRLKWGALAALGVTVAVLLTGTFVERPDLAPIQQTRLRYGEVIEFLEHGRPTLESGTVPFHVYDWMDGWDAIRQHPLLGAGFGSEFQRYHTLFPYVGGEEAGPGGLIHNQYLQFWWKMGLVGLCGFLWLIVRYLRAGAQLIPTLRNREHKAIAWGGYAAMWGLVAMGFWGAGWVGNTKIPALVLFSMATAMCLTRERSSGADGSRSAHL